MNISEIYIHVNSIRIIIKTNKLEKKEEEEEGSRSDDNDDDDDDIQCQKL